MNAEIFATFLARQGHRIIQTDSCFWYNAQPGFYFYFPYHKPIAPSDTELNGLIWGKASIGARFFTYLEYSGKKSYLIVCSGKSYDIESVDANYARRQTRRGIETFDIRQIGFKYLAKHGNSLNFDTLTRQGRDPRCWSEKRWRLYCLSAIGLPGFEAWGAFMGLDLASFLIGFQMEDHFTILHQSSSAKYLTFYPNNALIFFVTKLKLMSSGVSHVFYGPESLDAPKSLERFKFHMGFNKKPIKQCIIFNPMVKPFVNNVSLKIIQKIALKRPESDSWRKLAGILRFYQETH